MNNFQLEQIRIAAPCSVPWESMQGDSRKRFCEQCQLHVYNISDMTRQAAESFLQQAEGRVCINLFKRDDGTILTQDCPVGLKAIRRKFQKMVLFVGSVIFSSLVGASLYHKISKNGIQSEFLKKLFNSQPEPLHRLAGEVECIVTPTPAITSTLPATGSTSNEPAKETTEKEH